MDQDNTESEKVVRVIRFSGNRDVRNGTLRTLVRTDNNREFLGIPRFTPWYYLWRVFRVGESPAYLDREMVGNDIERIEVYYENLGYFEASVDTSIIEYRENRVEVSFIIDEGPRSEINTVSYTGLPEFDNPDRIPGFLGDSEFAGDFLNDSTFAVNEPYEVQKLRREQTRIVNFLKNHGYAAVQRDSVRALAKPVDDDPNAYDILFSIRPGSFYTFGDVHITLSGPEGEGNFDQSEEFSGEPYTTSGHTIYISKESSAQTRFSLLNEQIRYTPGEMFDQSAYLRSVNSFQNLGMLLTNRFALSEEGSAPDYSRSDIPTYFDLQTIPKHSIRAEFFGMRRYGFGTGVGLNYNNNNLRGRADNLTLGINTSLEYVTSNTLSEISPIDEETGERSQTGSTIFQSYEVRAEYTVPRLNFPFQVFRDRSWVRSARTRYALSYSQSNQLFFDINSDIRFNTRYEITHSDRFTSLFDLIEMDIIDTDPSSQFLQNLENQFGEQSIVLARINEDFRPQFSSIIRYTLRNRNTNLIKRNFGYSSEFSAAIGGNVPYLLDRFVFSPGEIKQTLPSPFGISSNALSYSRFLKFSADYRRYFDLTDNTVFALRGFAGFAQPIFDSESIPLNRRFFAGGSNDIRGWNPFRLGPGSISPDEVRVPGGEVKLAAYKELRQIFMRDVLNAQWHVAWHTDAGNVWYGPRSSLLDDDGNELLNDGRFYIDRFYNQIAVGSGFGLRLDWEFIVARFDFTFRVHDLDRGWFENRRGYFSFGIGHSF
ncbi:BamA/TamA family outer membrane protein [Rhodohalobacter sp. SW132]|uniref:BamA/TamA family outer membrane protein n=1 Tax=Rhodohalobacter sp. SW132 TaxID=2293433 RepID=UPI001F180C4C|nr:outer membrane protein assembly factor [Rhodohalobacter sp. SW132]